jgi:hypothetical protein
MPVGLQDKTVASRKKAYKYPPASELNWTLGSRSRKRFVAIGWAICSAGMSIKVGVVLPMFCTPIEPRAG